MKMLNMIFCMPCRELSDSKKEKPMKLSHMSISPKKIEWEHAHSGRPTKQEFPPDIGRCAPVLLENPDSSMEKLGVQRHCKFITVAVTRGSCAHATHFVVNAI